MDTNIKVSLYIELPGSTMYSKESSLVNGTPIPDRHNKEFLKVENGNGREETIVINTRKCIPAKKVVNLTEDAYNYFISDEKPYEYKGDWRKMTPAARLQYHMEELSKAMGGKMIDYVILN